MSSNEEIVLEIEGTSVTCNKNDLVSNSDYFKAMFEGNFIESNKSCVKIQGVDLKAVNIILTLVWDDTCSINEEDIFSVLQAASMLQFDKIKKMCIERIIETLSPKNYVKVWLMAEHLDINPLYLKAKLLALDMFLEVKDSAYLFELTLNEICVYLGHANLNTDTELTVFQTAMKWWYENCEQYSGDSTKSILKLLNCMNFQELSETDFNVVSSYPDIDNNSDICKILTCLLDLRSGLSIEEFTEDCVRNAQLLNKSKSRISACSLCILVNQYESNEISVCQDSFKRKRTYEPQGRKSNLCTLIYDQFSKSFKKIFDIDINKCQHLAGFKIFSYKNFVFMFGGEYLIGRGEWNLNFWVYDIVKEKWESKCVMPYPRRHFHSCIVGSKVYITGGTGTFRVTQVNLFWYDYESDRWSNKIALPIQDRQIKCCAFLNQYFLFSINEKCGYFFKEEGTLSNWIKVEAVIDRRNVSSQSEFLLFSFKDKLYIKGKKLIELILENSRLVVTTVKHISDKDWKKIELALCDNIVYTLYEYDTHSYTLEVYNLETESCHFIFDNISFDSDITADGQLYSPSVNMKIFAMKHYSQIR